MILLCLFEYEKKNIIYSFICLVRHSACFSQQQANYELANEFQAFGLGGNFTANSLNLWPNEINGTDKFWFEFHTTVGKDYYFVDPERRLKEPLFDKGKLASGIAQITRGVVDRNKLELSDIKFSENLASFLFLIKVGTMNIIA